jgi:hypothetical protein
MPIGFREALWEYRKARTIEEADMVCLDRGPEKGRQSGMAIKTKRGLRLTRITLSLEEPRAPQVLPWGTSLLKAIFRVFTS